ncbi:diguanylate cyclase domain-containing protein [Roseateles sp. DB2]|uniref:diguanylate cyclase domain-containing protein n=1 Tax=Roseateles sp. DB2 TaxID=3453717 RepID=UPI003EEBB0B5
MQAKSKLSSMPAGDASRDAPASRHSASLVARLTRWNLAVLVSTLLLCFGLIATAGWFSAQERQARLSHASAQVLANSLAPMLVFEDRDSALAELQSFIRRDDVLELQLLLANGKLFAAWEAPGQHSDLLVSQAIQVSEARHEADAQQLRVWIPVQLRGERVGVLYLRESLQALRQQLQQAIIVAALMMAVAILVAFHALRYVQRRALWPLVELSRLAEQVAADQNYGRRARVHHPDEVGRLTERFNQLLRRAEAWQAELNRQLREEQAAGQQYQRLAHEDALTKLPNRLYFQSALQHALAHSREHGESLSLMFIDLDNFKLVNDGHGHEAGDVVLSEVSRRMSSVLRSSDVLCRLGGDEFALILPGLGPQGVVTTLAQRVIAVVRDPILIKGQPVQVGATIGVASFPDDAVDDAGLLGQADAAMYAAKRAGKNTYRQAGKVNRHGA